MGEYDLTPSKRKDGSDTLPARGYSWDKFEPQNFKALRHGADSPRVREIASALVRAEVLDAAPWLASEIFEDALLRYARSEALSRILDSHILKIVEEQGPAKVPVRLWESRVGVSNAANRASEALGLTPLSRAKLAQISASAESLASRSLEDLSAVGKEIRAARAAAIDSESADDEEDDHELETQDEE